MTYADGRGRKVLHNNRARSDDAEFSDRHAGADKNIRAQPGILSDDNRFGDKGHAPLVEVVRPCAEVTILTDVGTILQPDAGEIVDCDVSSNHAARRERKTARENDFCAGKNDDRAGDISPENAQQPCAKAVQGSGTPAEKRRLHDQPDPAVKEFRLGIRRRAVLTEVGGFVGHGGEDGGLGSAVNFAKSASSESA